MLLFNKCENTAPKVQPHPSNICIMLILEMYAHLLATFNTTHKNRLFSVSSSLSPHLIKPLKYNTFSPTNLTYLYKYFIPDHIIISLRYPRQCFFMRYSDFLHQIPSEHWMSRYICMPYFSYLWNTQYKCTFQ